MAGAAAHEQPGVEVTLRVVTPVPGVGRHLDFEVRICNPGARSLEHMLPSTQVYDVVLRNTEREVWRWSRGMRFAMAMTPYRLGPGECKTYGVRWAASGGVLREWGGAPVKTGDYQALAAFTGGKQVWSEPVRFSIAPH